MSLKRFDNRMLRGSIMLAVAIAAGIAIGLVLVPRAPELDNPQETPPVVQLLGKPLSLEDGAPGRASARLRKLLSQRIELELPDGDVRSFFPGRLGVEIDKARLAQLVRDARDPTSPLRRTWRRSGETGPIELPLPIRVRDEQALPVLLGLKDDVDRPPVDARLDLEKKELIDEVWGRLLDVDASVRALEEALQRGERRAQVQYAKLRPRRIKAEIGNVRFDHVLGVFETPYDRSSRARARTYNLRLAASKLDGHVLLPGEELDFNGVVGPRDEANGYKVAAVIAEGELVDGVGGGTCQISGTLHGAAFFAGLEITERYPHTRPSSYIKLGMDATVVYPTINFRLRNPYDFPIVLHETVKKGRVRAEILGPEPAPTVTLVRRVTGHIPYQELERPDSSLPEGTRVLAQRGIPGFKLRRYRIVRNGPHAIRERWDEQYPPTSQIVRIGTAAEGGKKKRPRDDGHPEYTADELLVVTSRPDDENAQQVTKITRRTRGKYGESGWTEEAGMPIFKRD